MSMFFGGGVVVVGPRRETVFFVAFSRAGLAPDPSDWMGRLMPLCNNFVLNATHHRAVSHHRAVLCSNKRHISGQRGFPTRIMVSRRFPPLGKLCLADYYYSNDEATIERGYVCIYIVCFFFSPVHPRHILQ